MNIGFGSRVSLSRTPGAAGPSRRYAFDAMFSGAIAAARSCRLVPLSHTVLHGGGSSARNMLYLWIFGDPGGPAGSVRSWVYCLRHRCAIGQGRLAPRRSCARRAPSCVLGAYLISPTARVSTLVFLGIFITIVQLPAIIVIGMFIVLQIIEGIAELRLSVHAATQQIAYFAHVFGFLAGMLLLLVMRRGTAGRRTRGWG